MTEKRSEFDRIIDRRGTNCGKWDTMDKKYGRNDLIHLGVADMDFCSPDPIRESFRRCAEHGIFGYTDLNDAFYDGFISWMKRRHSVNVKREEIIFCPRINISSSLCVETLTDPGDQVMIHTPAYGPLYQAIVKNGRKPVECPLTRDGERYRIDFGGMEERITQDTRMMILCSPHNPTGRVWSREELEQIGEFCEKHDLILFVDEIHGDITAGSKEFVSALSLPEKYRKHLIVATSPTKTFNIPGVILSYLVIPEENIRRKISGDIDRIGMHNPTIFAVAAAEAAYSQCDDWYDEMIAYIDENDAFTRSYFAQHMPDFQILPREGTYLLWIDYGKLNCTEEELETWFIERANVSVYMGTVFGEAGRGCIRLNIASPRPLLKQAYDQMKAVYHEIRKR